MLQTTSTDDDRRQTSSLVWSSYAMCRRASTKYFSAVFPHVSGVRGHPGWNPVMHRVQNRPVWYPATVDPVQLPTWPTHELPRHVRNHASLDELQWTTARWPVTRDQPLTGAWTGAQPTAWQHTHPTMQCGPSCVRLSVRHNSVFYQYGWI